MYKINVLLRVTLPYFYLCWCTLCQQRALVWQVRMHSVYTWYAQQNDNHIADAAHYSWLLIAVNLFVILQQYLKNRLFVPQRSMFVPIPIKIPLSELMCLLKETMCTTGHVGPKQVAEVSTVFSLLFSTDILMGWLRKRYKMLSQPFWIYFNFSNPDWFACFFHPVKIIQHKVPLITQVEVGICPGCRTRWEKNGGCPYMICGNCGLPFCWNCLQPFKTHDYDLCERTVTQSKVCVSLMQSVQLVQHPLLTGGLVVRRPL